MPRSIQPTPPPSYTDASSSTNAQKLKESFGQLVLKQTDIYALFRSVVAQLESTQGIGEGHPLCAEWNALRKTHRKVYRDSQQNAAQCASFLDNYADILVPIARSSMPMAQKKLMINNFLEAIPVHISCATSITERFNELGKSIEAFPLKVTSTLRAHAESASFRGSRRTNSNQGLWMSLWESLRKLLMEIVRVFKQMLSRIQEIRFSFNIHLNELYEQLPSPPPVSARSAAAQIKDDCKELGNNLSMFEDAWHVVMLSCNELLHTIAVAKGFSPVPEACDRTLQSAAATYAPLVECLRAYSTGKKPVF